MKNELWLVNIQPFFKPVGVEVKELCQKVFEADWNRLKLTKVQSVQK
jgi:hypothetical protein